MPASNLPFSLAEYEERLVKTRREMAARNIDLLIVTDPSNMAWLTGYDGWSFYVHQAVIVSHDRQPIWWGRPMDAVGAGLTTWLSDASIFGYPDDFVQNPLKHPYSHLSGLLQDQFDRLGTIGVEMDNYYFSAACLETLRQECPQVPIRDATGLVNWQRAIKSERELEFMRRAARIVERMHAKIRDFVEPGVRKCDVAAEIYHTGLTGADGHGGDYTAIVPLMPAGAEGAAAHLTWDDKPLKSGEGIFFEIGGCYRRYHCPQSRTVYLGQPSQTFLDAEKAVLEGIDAALEAAKPGNLCEDIANAFNRRLNALGFEKDGRCGYAIGISYPPDWGERTMSFRAGDKTVLQPGMTFHFMPALWSTEGGLEITEPILITDTGVECLTNTPRKLHIKN